MMISRPVSILRYVARIASALGLIVMLLSQGQSAVALQDSTPPDGGAPAVVETEVVPPPTEAPPPPTEVPPPPTVPPPPPPTDVPVPPTEAPALTEAPAASGSTPTTAPPTETPAPTAIPAPTVVCVRDGLDGPVASNVPALFLCDFSSGPVQPALLQLPAGWQVSVPAPGSVDPENWVDQVEAELPVFSQETGVVRLFVRATETATPGPAMLTVTFRAADFSPAAPSVNVDFSLVLTEPTPTPEPPVPFEPVVDCVASVDPVAGASEWATQDCTVAWKTKNVKRVELAASTTAPDWHIVAVDTAAIADPATLDASDGSLQLVDDDPNDAGFFSARFSLGTRLACTSPLTSTIEMQLVSTSHAPVPQDAAGNSLVDISTTPEVIESVERTLATSAIMPPAPEISLASASFTPINLSDGAQSSTGTFVFSYANAAQACGSWQVTVRLGDFVNGDVSIPADTLRVDTVAGLDVSVTSVEPGSFRIEPVGTVDSATGSFTVTTSLALDGFVPEGSYTTTVSLDVTMLD